MTTGQTRVFVLLLVLAALEAIIQPTVRSVLKGAWYQFQTGLNNSTGGKS